MPNIFFFSYALHFVVAITTIIDLIMTNDEKINKSMHEFARIFNDEREREKRGSFNNKEMTITRK